MGTFPTVWLAGGCRPGHLVLLSSRAKAGRSAKAVPVITAPPPISTHSGKRYQNSSGSTMFSTGSSAMPTSQTSAPAGHPRQTRRPSLTTSGQRV